MSKLQAPFVEQNLRREKNLSTPVMFSVDLELTSTPIYTGLVGKVFLIRQISVCNHTAGHGGSSTRLLTITGNGSEWLDEYEVAPKTTEYIPGLSGILMADGQDLAGFSDGTHMTVFGWGLQIEGGDAWRL